MRSSTKISIELTHSLQPLVRSARHNIIVLRNDLKEMTRRIEDGLLNLGSILQNSILAENVLDKFSPGNNTYEFIFVLWTMTFKLTVFQSHIIGMNVRS
jgi:hypothetical protein